MPEKSRLSLPDVLVPQANRPAYDQRKPVFFGHYWMQGQPELQSEKMACVDYSAGNGGPLVAYRWEGEDRLDSKNFFFEKH